MQSDPLGDFLTMLRNASRSMKDEVVTSHSRLKGEVAKVLKAEGYLDNVEKIEDDPKKPQLKCVLRRVGRKSAITDIQRMSKPGLRRYVGADEVPKVLGGLGITVLSTSQGIMPGHLARRRRLGGELLLRVH
ncbi:MAG: 30S ribosomal protein S8 [Verrucomicrobiota bacterium]